MQIQRFSVPHTAAARATAQQPPAPPAESPCPKDYVLPVAGGLALGAGLGYAGFYAGAQTGLLAGMLLTPAEASLGDLLVNMGRGIQIGAFSGAAIFGLAGGVLGGMAIYDLMHPPQEQGA